MTSEKPHIGFYKIFKNKEFSMEYHTGLLSRNEIIGFKKEQMNNKAFRSVRKSLVIFDKIHLANGVKSVDKYIEFLESQKEILNKRDIALIANLPSEVVVASLLKMEARHLGYNIREFSTLSAALTWLGINAQLEQLQQVFNEVGLNGASILKRF